MKCINKTLGVWVLKGIAGKQTSRIFFGCFHTFSCFSLFLFQGLLVIFSLKTEKKMG